MSRPQVFHETCCQILCTTVTRLAQEWDALACFKLPIGRDENPGFDVCTCGKGNLRRLPSAFTSSMYSKTPKDFENNQAPTTRGRSPMAKKQSSRVTSCAEMMNWMRIHCAVINGVGSGIRFQYTIVDCPYFAGADGKTALGACSK